MERSAGDDTTDVDTSIWCEIARSDGGKARCRCGGELTPRPGEVPNPDAVEAVRCAVTGVLVGTYACAGYCDARIWWTEGTTDDSLPPLQVGDQLAVHWIEDRAKFPIPDSVVIRGYVIPGGYWPDDHQACWDGAGLAEVVAADEDDGRDGHGNNGREATVVPT